MAHSNWCGDRCWSGVIRGVFVNDVATTYCGEEIGCTPWLGMCSWFCGNECTNPAIDYRHPRGGWDFLNKCHHSGTREIRRMGTLFKSFDSTHQFLGRQRRIVMVTNYVFPLSRSRQRKQLRFDCIEELVAMVSVVINNDPLQSGRLCRHVKIPSSLWRLMVKKIWHTVRASHLGKMSAEGRCECSFIGRERTFDVHRCGTPRGDVQAQGSLDVVEGTLRRDGDCCERACDGSVGRMVGSHRKDARFRILVRRGWQMLRRHRGRQWIASRTGMPLALRNRACPHQRGARSDGCGVLCPFV